MPICVFFMGFLLKLKRLRLNLCLMGLGGGGHFTIVCKRTEKSQKKHIGQSLFLQNVF